MQRALVVAAVVAVVATGIAIAQDRSVTRAERGKRAVAVLEAALSQAERAKPVDETWVARLRVAADDVRVLAAPPRLGDLTDEEVQALRDELASADQPAPALAWTENDWDGALERAQRDGRPVLFDVTAAGCVNCAELRRAVSEMPKALRFMSDRFELARIWIADPKISPLDEKQRARAKKEFGTAVVPLHVIVDPRSNSELARLDYTPYVTPEDYLEFLEAGLREYSEK